MVKPSKVVLLNIETPLRNVTKYNNNSSKVRGWVGPLWKLYPSKVFYCETLPYFTQFCSVREIFGVAPLGPDMLLPRVGGNPSVVQVPVQLPLAN